jgi:cation transport ATPase
MSLLSSERDSDCSTLSNSNAGFPRRIACVESKSSHPLAPALVAYALTRGVEPTGDVSDFEIIPGMGVSAVVDGSKVQIGNARLAAEFLGSEGKFGNLECLVSDSKGKFCRTA